MNSYYLICLLTACTLTVDAQIHVNLAATGAADGSSWENAYTDLHDALGNAFPNDTIWVATGVYRPDGHSGNLAATFLI